MSPVFKRTVWWVNSLGFVLFLAWLATMSDRQILREQDGIVYFLPCLPFFFVYMLLFEPKPRKTPPDAPSTAAPDGKSGGAGAGRHETDA